jgi:predicted CoA-substrate-specific enzyme activase
MVTWFMGIDVGSTTTKGVLVKDGEPEFLRAVPSGTDYRASAEELRRQLLADAGLTFEEVAGTVATGHTGAVPFASGYATDIQCCARGMNRTYTSVRTAIDIQGQASQVIRVGPQGQAYGFAVSEKCAGGSERFLDVVAHVLQIDIDEVGPLSLKSLRPVIFSTGCAVFSESEAISMVAEGAAKEDILAGVHKALAEKIYALVARVELEEPCAISGGGGLNIGLVKAVEDRLGIRVLVPPRPEFTGARGAAAIAEERMKSLTPGG